jgi:hypothetical protein
MPRTGPGVEADGQLARCTQKYEYHEAREGVACGSASSLADGRCSAQRFDACRSQGILPQGKDIRHSAHRPAQETAAPVRGLGFGSLKLDTISL